MTPRSTATLVIALLLVVVACGDDSATTASTTSSTTTTTLATTVVPTTATTSPPTTVSVPDSARASLERYISEVEDLDRAIADAATLFNESWETTGTVGAEAQAAILAIDTSHLRALLPAGLAPELELAALAVFADLDSRASALAGAERFSTQFPDDVILCLKFGATSFQRFDDDLDHLVALAATSPAPTAAPDSVEAGILAVQLEAIHSMNWGCDSCGGVQYDTALPVDWEARTVLDGVEFEAEFVDGAWEVLIYAC